MINEHELGERLGNIIKHGDWIKPKLDRLQPWARKLVATFFDRHGIGWQVSKEKVNEALVVKIDDPRIKYMLVLPHQCYAGQQCDQFYWMIGDDPNNDDHSIHPDQASAYLMAREFPGIKITDERGDDGSCISTMEMPEGNKIVIAFPPGTFSDKTYAPKDS